jgi:hypothetical protein
VKVEQRLYVVKDDAQPTCAISGEPFNETWDEELQEWIYMDAVRVPPALLSDVGLQPGAIVKVALLDTKTVEKIRDMNEDNRKRKAGDSDGGSQKRMKRAQDDSDDE